MPLERNWQPSPAYDAAMPTLPRDKQAAEVKDQEPFTAAEAFKGIPVMPYMSPAEEARYWADRRKEEVAAGMSLWALPPGSMAAMENCLTAEGMGLASTADAEDSLGRDSVTLPVHYARFKVEPIRFICENGLNFFQGNIVKYVLRHDAKNGLEDLRKARRYLDMFIKFQEGDSEWWR